MNRILVQVYILRSVQTTGGAVGGATGGAAAGGAGAGAAGAGAAGAGGAAAGAAAAPGVAAAGTGLATTGAGLTTAAGTAAEMSWVPENINSKGLCYTAWKILLFWHYFCSSTYSCSCYCLLEYMETITLNNKVLF